MPDSPRPEEGDIVTGVYTGEHHTASPGLLPAQLPGAPPDSGLALPAWAVGQASRGQGGPRGLPPLAPARRELWAGGTWST